MGRTRWGVGSIVVLKDAMGARFGYFCERVRCGGSLHHARHLYAKRRVLGADTRNQDSVLRPRGIWGSGDLVFWSCFGAEKEGFGRAGKCCRSGKGRSCGKYGVEEATAKSGPKNANEAEVRETRAKRAFLEGEYVSVSLCRIFLCALVSISRHGCGELPHRTRCSHEQAHARNP